VAGVVGSIATRVGVRLVRLAVDDVVVDVEVDVDVDVDVDVVVVVVA